MIAFTDDDCVPAPDWLERGLGACAERPGEIVQGRTEPDPAQLDRLGPFSRTIEVDGYDAAFQTCNIFYPRAVLERVDGFDTEAFGRVHGGEDSDLAWRAIEAGTAAGFDAAAARPPRGQRARSARQDPPRRRLVAARLRPPPRAPPRQLRDAAVLEAHPRLARQGAARPARPRRLWPLRIWLALPWLRSLAARGKLEGGGLRLAPFYAACDAAEMYACIRNSARHRTLML